MANDRSIIFEWSPRFERAFKKLPKEIQRLFGDKIAQFEDDWQHPSFRTKRIQGTDNIWEASLNMSIRFTFECIIDDKGQRVAFAYALAVFLIVILSIPYWTLIGLIH